jgi:glycosyltransferase involved in cell wall biosynthesis
MPDPLVAEEALIDQPTAAFGGRPAAATRALFVNSGILGHRAVAELLRESAGLMPSIDARHIDLSGDLTLGDRIVRRLLSVALCPRTGPAANLDVRRWRQELNTGLLAARRIAAAERRRPVDVLHFHTQATAYCSLRRMRRTPSVVSIDATQRLASREAGSWIGRATYGPNIAHDACVFRAAAAIIATSEWAARDLAAHQPEVADKVRVMPYPVRWLGDAAWIDERSNRARQEPRAPVRVLFMGGDFPRKGGFDLLRAWHDGALAERATLDLVTDWPLEADRLPAGVRLVRGIAPYTPAWRELWQRADLFVMPPHHEAFGMVFQEAAAAALPVVATRVNAIPEIVRDGRTGVLVPPGDPAALARAVRALVDSPPERRRLGAAARERVAMLNAPQAYARALESLMCDLVEHHGFHTV